MTGVKTACTDKFDGLVEGEAVFLDIVNQPLEVAECCMSFVAVIDVFLDSKLLQQQHTTDTKENLLLESVLPVATIECVGNRTVEFGVHFVIGIEQIEADTTDIDTPYIGMYHVICIRYIYNQRIAVFIKLTDNGQGVEVLCIVVGNLLSFNGKTLLEVAIAIEETDGTHVDIRVGCFLHIVTCQHAKTSRVDFQHLIETVFHTEIGNGRTL